METCPSLAVLSRPRRRSASAQPTFERLFVTGVCREMMGDGSALAHDMWIETVYE